ncbi:MAG TPA: hypothetical protein VHK88_03775 [Aquihabitans sp.]|jgi:hypothetical protein|nr:hypothetical protein [Aquihabitans sp.]
MTTAPAPTRPTTETSRHRRRTRSVPVRTLLGVGAAAWLAVVLGACGDGSSSAVDAPAKASAADQGRADADPHTVDVVLDDFSFTAVDTEAAPGPVTIRARNEGAEPHQLTIGRPTGDLTAANFAERFERDGEAAVIDQVEWAGGPNALPPGETGVAVADLAPGDYIVVCFMPSADGTSHVMKGMVSELHVGEPDPTAPPTAEPVASETIEVEDFAIRLPEGFEGKGLVELANVGEQPHELVLLRPRDGKGIADIVAWNEAGQQGPPPYDFAGGLGVIEAGTSGWTELDLEPGSYLAVCVVPDLLGDGAPHVDHGMVATFEVT